MNIVITIPAYNEEKNIVQVIEDIKKVMNQTNYKYKILVVDDGSKDNTARLAKKAGAVVYSHPVNCGLADTFRSEMKKCLEMKADIIVHTDADGQYPANYIPNMIEKIKEGYDLVLGSRFGEGSYKGTIMKRLGNIAFARVLSGILKIKLTDSTTGFRAFNSKVAGLPLINDFTYTQEQLIRAGKSKMNIIEIPIKTNKTRESKLFKSSFDYAIKAWINIFRIYRDFEPLKFFGRIGLLMMLPGIIMGIYMLLNLLLTGHVGYLNISILASLFVLTGLHIILFGFLADKDRK